MNLFEFLDMNLLTFFGFHGLEWSWVWYFVVGNRILVIVWLIPFVIGVGGIVVVFLCFFIIILKFADGIRLLS